MLSDAELKKIDELLTKAESGELIIISDYARELSGRKLQDFFNRYIELTSLNL